MVERLRFLENVFYNKKLKIFNFFVIFVDICCINLMKYLFWGLIGNEMFNYNVFDF